MSDKLAPDQRHSFIHKGQKVFEWDQTLDEVNMYIDLPQNVPTKLFHCKIQSKHVEVGIKGNPPYLNELEVRKREAWAWFKKFINFRGTDELSPKPGHDFQHPVKTDCSFWTLEDNTMHITLQKRDKGQTWSSPIVGEGQLDPYSTDLEQKRLMLQRFQEENPGFDFSQAQFSGNCPDPKTFMGGIH